MVGANALLQVVSLQQGPPTIARTAYTGPTAVQSSGLVRREWSMPPTVSEHVFRKRAASELRDFLNPRVPFPQYYSVHTGAHRLSSRNARCHLHFSGGSPRTGGGEGGELCSRAQTVETRGLCQNCRASPTSRPCGSLVNSSPPIEIPHNCTPNPFTM